LLHLGHKPEEVAEMVAVAASTIWTWYRRYRAEGWANPRRWNHWLSEPTWSSWSSRLRAVLSV